MKFRTISTPKRIITVISYNTYKQAHNEKKIEIGKLFINLFEECHILTVHVVTDLEKSPFSSP